LRTRVVETHGRWAGLHLALLRILFLTTGLLGRGERWGPVLLGRLFPQANAVTLQLTEASLLRVRLADGYWVRLLAPRYRYEPEIAALLKAALGRSSLFIDGGANIGYWSVLASESTPTVAVEPAPPTAASLRANRSLNGDRFSVVEAALWETAGRTDLFHSVHNHAGDSLEGPSNHQYSGEAQVYSVATLTLDELARSQSASDGVVLKLDVEGAEIAALRGARELLRRDTLVIFEDHGNDDACRISDFVLNDLGLPVWGWDQGRWRAFSTIEDIRAVKTDPYNGYNFVTCTPGSRFLTLFEPGTRG
jgi:FkbM family methyltransferase